MKLQLKDWLATLVTLLVGVPLVMLFSSAMLEGETRRRENPLRTMLGDESYEALARGTTPELGYFGDDRLAPDFELRDRQGRPWRLREHRGKVIVLNFWSITCPPCIEEMPSLLALDEALRGRSDVELVTVTTDANWETVAPIFTNGTQLTVLFDPDKRVVGGLFGTRMLPETWIIDPEGVIRVRVDGARDWSTPLARELITSYVR